MERFTLPTDVTNDLLERALRGLEQIYRLGYSYKKVGVMLNHLMPAGQISKRLFVDAAFERARNVMTAVDQINARHGRDTVRFGVARPDGHWKTKFLRRSRRYTTCFKEILSIS